MAPEMSGNIESRLSPRPLTVKEGHDPVTTPKKKDDKGQCTTSRTHRPALIRCHRLRKLYILALLFIHSEGLTTEPLQREIYNLVTSLNAGSVPPGEGSGRDAVPVDVMSHLFVSGFPAYRGETPHAGIGRKLPEFGPRWVKSIWTLMAAEAGDERIFKLSYVAYSKVFRDGAPPFKGAELGAICGPLPGAVGRQGYEPVLGRGGPQAGTVGSSR